MAEPIAGPGWYRLTEQGWQRVDDETALADIATMADGYQDLLYYATTAPMAEDPLF
jgi:hypothetical protein